MGGSEGPPGLRVGGKRALEAPLRGCNPRTPPEPAWGRGIQDTTLACTWAGRVTVSSVTFRPQKLLREAQLQGREAAVCRWHCLAPRTTQQLDGGYGGLAGEGGLLAY